MDVQRVHDPAGDRVVVTLDGKFLPYQWWTHRSGCQAATCRRGTPSRNNPDRAGECRPSEPADSPRPTGRWCSIWPRASETIVAVAGSVEHGQDREYVLGEGLADRSQPDAPRVGRGVQKWDADGRPGTAVPATRA
ncbi:cyanase [Amycolatopsis alkalitolerans]|uniref:cyanase n=1 Tax=Amycolatopsis alkalitolerans TaxID=2547244 RepID=UPI00190FBBC9